MRALVRPELPELTIDALRTRVAEQQVLLDARRVDVSRLKADLDAFRIRYRTEVGLLHEELDRLELALAEAELGILTDRLRCEPGAAEKPATLQPESAPRFTSDALRKLFRDVAKAIHPDLAPDEATRDHRHGLMIEANRAYALGDEEQLRVILAAWERSPEAVHGTDSAAMRLRLIRRSEQIVEQLALLANELDAMQATALWRLKALVDEETAKGNDVIADMVRRLKRDILVTTNRLHAIRPPDEPANPPDSINPSSPR